ncbi:MAG: extracellular solute-binding protein [Alphaproteobacteria bacterium]
MNKLTSALLGSAVAVGLAVGAVAPASAETEITYWQYSFGARVDAIDSLIAQFEAANPDIKVNQVNFPYADYRIKVSAAIPAGEGPDVVQLFYGWLDAYREAGLLSPLPAALTGDVASDYFPMVSAMEVDGDFWGLPTAVRSLALFYNTDLFEEAGLSGPPETLDELVSMAKKLTKRDDAGNLLQVGFTVVPTGQDHHWWREVLVRQFGGEPYNAAGTEVTYNSDAGIAALQFYVDLVGEDGVSEIGFLTDGQTAFKAGKAGMTIDGSFRLGSFNKQRGLNYAITELPAHDGNRFNYSSYWVNGLAAKSEGEQRAAAEKFLAFITTNDAMQLWLDTVGELPARPAIALVDANKTNPQFGPFIRGLAYANATHFVDEGAQRQIMVDMVDNVTLKGMSAADAVAIAAEEEQKLLDKFYGS